MPDERVMIIQRRAPSKKRAPISFNRNYRDSTTAFTDTDALEDYETAAEFDNHKPMGERWGETNYATVLRQSNSHTRLQNSRQEDATVKMITVHSIPQVSSARSDEPANRSSVVIERILPNKHARHVSHCQNPNLQKIRNLSMPPTNSSPKMEAMHRSPIVIERFTPDTSETYLSAHEIVQRILNNNGHPEVLTNGHLETSPEPASHLDDPSVSPNLIKEKSQTLPPLSLSPRTETNNMPTEISDDGSFESFVEEISRLPETPVINSNFHEVRSQTLPQLNSSPKTETPSPLKPIDRSRCFVCGTPVYMLESICVLDRNYHKKCFRCHKCQRVLSIGNYSVGEGNPYCKPHYIELFRMTGRYEGASINNYDDLRLQRSVIQSSTPSETARERPPPQLTRTLVAKFQQMCSDGSGIFGNERCLSSPGLDQTSISNSPRRSSVSVNLPSSTAPVPTPFHQAGQLLKAEVDRKNSIEFDSGDTSSITQATISSDGDFPNPGLTKKLVAKFSALHTA